MKNQGNLKDNRRTKRILRAAACGFMLTVLLSFTDFSAACGVLEGGVLRLHIVANSDSAADQRVKLLVRDAVLAVTADTFDSAESRFEAESAVCTNMEAIERAANAVLEAENAPYTACAEICDMYFSTRQYEGFSLPAGKYRALRITLGKAEGENWWCVVFPALCTSGAAELDALPGRVERLVTEEPEIEIKWKAAELFNALRDFFDD